MHACLIAASPALQLALPAAVPAPRLAPPKMQIGLAPYTGPYGSGYGVARNAGPRRAGPFSGGGWMDSSIMVQGGSLRTWSYQSPAVEQVQIFMDTEGRPLDAEVELWNGPNNTPVKMKVHGEDGWLRPVSAVIETPRSPNTVAIRNTGPIEYPMAANVFPCSIYNPVYTPNSECVQGGGQRTFEVDPMSDSVQVLVSTDGHPLNARIELLQGPDDIKQVIELYTDDGIDRPVMIILGTPHTEAGPYSVVRVVNTGTVEFPIYASLSPAFGTTPGPTGGSRGYGGGGYGYGGYGFGGGRSLGARRVGWDPVYAREDFYGRRGDYGYGYDSW